jgi:hypothetical protein
MAYRRNNGGASLLSKAPNPSQVLNLALVGGIAYAAYLVYTKFLSKFGNDPIDDAKQKAAVITGSAYVDTAASKVVTQQNTTTALATAGYVVNNDHQQIANTLHDMMNTTGFVAGDKIVATIKNMAIQTFQLVATAYGTRNLNAYAKSPAHLLTSAAWVDLFKVDKDVGTLKDHLKITLSSSQLSQISTYLSKIS